MLEISFMYKVILNNILQQGNVGETYNIGGKN